MTGVCRTIRVCYRYVLRVACLALLPLMPGPCVAGDGDSLLTRKYFDYRERLKAQFLSGMGTGFGESVPASIRGTWDKDYRGRQTMSWGDATIDLGLYMGVLATEYHLLVSGGRETEPTVAELYFALEAMNRLDRYAGGYYGANDSLDGFFVRSDIGRGLFDAGQRGPGYQKVLRRVNRGSPDSIDNLRSEWVSHHLFGKRKRFAASKDQVIHLFAGLMLVVRCVPDSVTFRGRPFMDGEVSLAREAGHITDRIMAWMHPPGRSNFITNWRLREPSGKRVGAGYNAWSFAHGFSRSQKLISGTENPRKRGFSYWMSKAVYNFTWLAFRPIYFFSRSESLKTLTLVALNNTCNGNAEKVYRYSMAFGKYTWYHIPLLYGFLHGAYSERIDWPHYRHMLHEAPDEGPHYSLETGYASETWSSTSLLIHPERRGQERPYFPGRYNGLDYLLLYNLYLAGTGSGY